MPFLEYLYINVFQAVLFYFNYHCIQLSGRHTWLSSYFRKYLWIWGRVTLLHESENWTTSLSLLTNLTQNLPLDYTLRYERMYLGESKLSITISYIINLHISWINSYTQPLQVWSPYKFWYPKPILACMGLGSYMHGDCLLLLLIHYKLNVL